MNTGQMILTMGAMIFLSAMVLRVNTVSLQNTSALYDSKYDILAVSIGNTMLEEISKKAFDEKTISNTLKKESQLTSKSFLGPENETRSKFDDIDDYNGYSFVDSTMPSAKYNISCSVGYVSDSNPDKVISDRKWTKKITIKITSKSMRDTITVSSLYSYWVFR